MFRIRPSLSLVAAALAIGTTALGPTAHADYVQPHITHAPFGRVRMVVPITSADPAVWGFKLHNLQNSEVGIPQWKGRLEARVVLYGPGVKLLERPMDDKLKAAVDTLRREGVRFDICNNTLKAMQLDWHTLYGVKESDIVPSGFLEVAWLANHGWAIDPMN